MAVSSGTLYIGGTFTEVQDRSGISQPRSRLAAVDVATCELTAWTAEADAEVSAVAVNADTVYIGGSFLAVGGQTRSRLAALSSTTGQVLAWSPPMNNRVRTLAASATTLYVGGDFAKVGTAPRSKLAAFSIASGSLDAAWRPVANAKVSTLALNPDGSRVYVGGSFTSLNGRTEYAYLGALNSGTGDTAPEFNPNALYPIGSLVADSRGLYAGGAGHGGHLVIWNHDGSLQQPVYQTDGNVQAVAVDGDSLYAGGHFTNYCVDNIGSGSPFICQNPLPRRKAFQVSLSTGQLTSWAPPFNSAFGIICAIVDPATHTLWVGGDFTQVSGQPVAHLAQFVNQ